MLARTFRDNLRAAVKDRKTSIKVVSYKAGYNYGYVRKVMSGCRTNPTIQFVEALAGALNMNPLDLLKDHGGNND